MEERRRKKVKIFYNPDGCPMSACVKKGDELKFHLGAIKKGIVNHPPTFLSFYNLVSTTEINQNSRDYIIYFLKLRICTYVVCGEGHFWNFRGNENIVVCKNGNKKLSLHTFFVFIILGFIRPVVVYIRLLTDLALVGCCLIR